MAKVFHTSRAERDLLDIWEYVAEDSAPAADRWLERVAEACRMLAGNPRGGRARDELGPALRSFPVGSYVVFYRPVHGGIVVVRVLHGSRDVPGLL